MNTKMKQTEETSVHYEYEEPVVDVIWFDAEDVIATSCTEELPLDE